MAGCRSRSSLALLLAVALFGAEARGVTLYSETAELPVFDGDPGYSLSNVSPSTSNLAYANHRLYYTFVRCLSSGGPPARCQPGTAVDGVYVRAYNVKLGAWEPRIKLFDKTDKQGSTWESGFHDAPAVLAQGAKLHAINPDIYCTDAACANAQVGYDGFGIRDPATGCYQSASTAGSYYRSAVIPPSPNGLASLVPNATTPSGSLCAPASWNVAGGAGKPNVYDTKGATLANGKAVVFGETGTFDAGTTGQGVAIWQITAAGSWTGPYMLIAGALSAESSSAASAGPPPSLACTAAGSKTFVKANIRARGNRLGMVWNPRVNANLVPVQHSYEIFYAESTDGGVSWHDKTGGNSWTPTNSGTTTESAALPFDGGAAKASFLVYAGNVDQGNEMSFDLDPDGRPAILVRKADANNTLVCGHPNVAVPNAGDNYSLHLRRWTGAAWVETAIDSEIDWGGGDELAEWGGVDKIPVLVIDALGRYWIIKSGTPNHSHPGMAYKVSTDKGATFGPWVDLTQDVHAVVGACSAALEQCRPSRLYAVFDIDRNWVAFSYYNNRTRLAYLKRLGLVDPAEQRIGRTP